jgi:hypothetical protein
MRSRQLHGSLRQFAQQAGSAMAAACVAGSELGFEVVQEGGRGSRTPLYCYRSLIGEFVERHAAELRELDGFLPAVHALAALDGLDAYLDAQGAPRPDGGRRELAEAALLRFLARVFDGADQDFALTPERFEPAYRGLEQVILEGRTDTVVLGLLRGITTESREVPLGDGALLVPPDCLDDLPPDPDWLARGAPSLVVAIAPGDDRDALEPAIARLRDLQSAMRLFAPGIALAPLAWVRAQGSRWRPVPLAAAIPTPDGKLVIAPEQEDELRAFCSLTVRRWPRDGELAWALSRFELGCERAERLCALTDYLLALRALLEPEGPRSGRLAGRLAALCAVADERDALAEDVARAISLEQAVIAGLAEVDDDALELVGELERHLRNVLRDVICGHLDAGLSVVADELIAGDFEPDGEAEVEREPEPDGPDAYEDLEAWGEPAPAWPVQQVSTTSRGSG